jgi:hypothetical protein
MSGTTTPRFLSLDHKKDGGHVEVVEFFYFFHYIHLCNIDYHYMVFRQRLHGDLGASFVSSVTGL